jgi:hypothetical protein
MAIDFKARYLTAQVSDREPLTSEEEIYIKEVEDFIDDKIMKEITTDNTEVWIDKAYVSFVYNNVNKKRQYKPMTNTRRNLLQETLLNKYKKKNWEIKWHIDDGLDGPNMSGGDYLILKGIK